jgi:hypothetical protein
MNETSPVIDRYLHLMQEILINAIDAELPGGGGGFSEGPRSWGGNCGY